MKNLKNILIVIASLVSVGVTQAGIGDFIEYSKQQGSSYYSRGNYMREDWLLNAVGHIVNGPLTKSNKPLVLQLLLQSVDTLIGVPLRNNTHISDEKYANITSNVERQVRNFVNKLYIGSVYKPSR